MVPDHSRDEKNSRGKVERNHDKSRSYDGKGEELRSQVRKNHHKHRHCDDKVEKACSRDKHRSCDKFEKERNHDKHKRQRGNDPDYTLKEVEYKKRRTNGNDGHLHAGNGAAYQVQDQQGNDDRLGNAKSHSGLKGTKNNQTRKRSVDAEDKRYRRQSERNPSKDDKQRQYYKRSVGPTNTEWQGTGKASEAINSPGQSSEESVSMSDMEKSTEFEDRIINRRVRFIGKDLEADEMQASFSNRCIPHSTQRSRLRGFQ